MSLYNLIQAYNNSSEESMYKSIKIISDFINDKSSDDQIMEKVHESAINWLNDDDNPFGTSKIWCYFNSKK